MTFIFPSILWALSLVIIPILIHLFHFKKNKTLYFSSLTFLNIVDNQNKSTKNLKHFLILLTRVLMFICIIISFAQPILKNSLRTESISNTVSIYIDNSFSMSKTGIEGELLSQAKENAKDFIKKSNLDLKFKIITNELSSLQQNNLNKVDAINKVDEIKLTPISRKLSDVINWNSNYTEQYKIKNLILYSDFQKNTSTLNKTPSDSLTNIYAIKLSPTNENNLYIDSVWFNNPYHIKNTQNDINIRIQNKNNEDLKNIEINITLKGLNRTLFTDINSNSKKIVSFNYIETETKQNKGKITINDNHCSFDNSYYLNYNITKNINVLLINCENQSKNIKAVYELDDFYSINEIDKKSITYNHFNQNDLIILNGITEINPGLTQSLNEFVEKGKSIIIFPGIIEETNVINLNSLLNKLKLPELIDISENGNMLKSINYETVFFKPIFEKKPDNLNIPLIKKSFITRTSTPTLSLIKLQNGNSLFFKSQNSKSYLFASSLNKEFSDFVSSALFPSILLRTAEMSLEYLPNAITLGKNAFVQLNNFNYSESPIHISNGELDIIPQTELKNNQLSVYLGELETISNIKAGNFDVLQNKKIINEISVNYDRKESDTEYLSLNQINERFEISYPNKNKILELKNGNLPINLELKKDKEYWKHFLILSLFLILLEIFLLKFWNLKSNKRK